MMGDNTLMSRSYVFHKPTAATASTDTVALRGMGYTIAHNSARIVVRMPIS